MLKVLLLYVLISKIFSEDCSNFNDEYYCENNQIAYPESWDERSFQTPPRYVLNWRENFQDMNYLVGYAQLKYSSNRKFCTINFITKVNPNINTLFSRSCPANFFELFFKNSKTGHEPCLKHNKKSSKENLFLYK